MSDRPETPIKRAVLVVAVVVAVVASGAAVASVVDDARHGAAGLSPRQSATPRDRDRTETDADGGRVNRFHDHRQCRLAHGLLRGNWTHGAYVSAVAHEAPGERVREAARSDCGKPLVAIRGAHAKAKPRA